jgi:hypothetical protein
VKLRSTTTSQCQRRGCPETGTSRTDINFKRTIFLCDTAFFHSKPMNSGRYSESLGSEKAGRAWATDEDKGSPETMPNFRYCHLRKLVQLGDGLVADGS